MISVFNIWLVLGPALVLAIISGYMSERVGIVNIAINGMMTFGFMFFAIFSNLFKNAMNEGDSYEWTYLASLLISTILSIVVGALFAFATIKLKSDHIIAGTGINLLAIGIGSIISDRSNSIIGTTNSTLANQYNPRTFIGDGVILQNLICFIIGLIIIVTIYVIMNWTKLGLRYRACGENPNALDAQGINVIKYQWIGLLVVGAIAGLSGSLFGYSTSLKQFTGDVDGLGFIALALLIVSSWKILPAFFIGLIFALFLTYTKQEVGSEEISYLLKMTPFLLTLIVMVLFGKFISGPKAAGTHFDKGLR